MAKRSRCKWWGDHGHGVSRTWVILDHGCNWWEAEVRGPNKVPEGPCLPVADGILHWMPPYLAVEAMGLKLKTGCSKEAVVADGIPYRMPQ